MFSIHQYILVYVYMFGKESRKLAMIVLLLFINLPINCVIRSLTLYHRYVNNYYSTTCLMTLECHKIE